MFDIQIFDPDSFVLLGSEDFPPKFFTQQEAQQINELRYSYE